MLKALLSNKLPKGVKETLAIALLNTWLLSKFKKRLVKHITIDGQHIRYELQHDTDATSAIMVDYKGSIVDYLEDTLGL